MRDLVVITEDRPGVLRHIGHTLGNAGINIEGLAAFTGEGRSVVHILVAELEPALMALTAAGHEARAVNDAVVVNLPDRPDALATALEPVARAGINIRLSYVAVGSRAETRLVIVTDDPDATRALLDQP